MLKTLLFAVLWQFAICRVAHGQPAARAPLSYSFAVEHDSEFGLVPMLALSIPLDSVRVLAVYGTYYSASVSRSLETGVSLLLPPFRWGISLTPAAGLISGRYFLADASLALSEGYTGSLTAEKSSGPLTLQGYGAYYGALRRKGSATYDFTFYQLAAGYDLSKSFAVGVIHEHFSTLSLPRNRTDTTSSAYRIVRVGLFVQQDLSKDWQLMLAGGWLADSFVRISLGHSWSLGRKGSPARM